MASRTNNSLRNITLALLNQGLVTILTFITRTVLVKELGAEYVGVNGLFTNIISVLSLAELGINLAIPYSLYKPLAENDQKKINILMRLYSRIYMTIGVVVLFLGTAITPFLELFVNQMPNISEIRIIYLLFVLNSGISYFWAYKGLLITSDQKAFVLTKINNNTSIVLAVLQCIFLCVTQSFIVYLLCNTAVTIIKNFCISHECDKRYPYLSEKIKDRLTKEELGEIKKNIFSVCLYRIGTVLLNSTDGIILSKFISVAVNGYYSNYTMITNALNSVLSQISNGIVASIGNATATESREYNHTLFKRLDFVNYWIYGVCTICLWVLMNPFVDLWIGENYRLDYITVWAISMNFYVLGMLGINSAFRNTYGLFWYGKFRPIVMAAINISLDIILVRTMGVFGVVFATLIARLLTTVWYDPYIVFKHGFKHSVKKYYFHYILRFAVVNIIGVLISILVQQIIEWSWLKWIVTAMVVFILANAIFLVLYFRTEEFKYVFENIKKIINLILKKK